MEILSKAIAAVQRNLVALGIYVGINVSVSAAVLLLRTFVLSEPPGEALRAPMLIVAEVFLKGGIVVCSAAAQAIVFSRMAKEMDRPLWRIEGDREALARYFFLWVAFNVPVMVLWEINMWVAAVFEDGQNVAVLAAHLAFLAAVSCYIPAGAAVMFHGRPQWKGFAGNFVPLWRQAPATMLVVFINGLVFSFCFSLQLQTLSQQWLWPAVDLILAYFDCVVFCATLQICIHNRQNPDEDEFDF